MRQPAAHHPRGLYSPPIAHIEKGPITAMPDYTALTASREMDAATITITLPAGAPAIRRGDYLIVRAIDGDTLRIIPEDAMRAIATRLLAD